MLWGRSAEIEVLGWKDTKHFCTPRSQDSHLPGTIYPTFLTGRGRFGGGSMQCSRFPFYTRLYVYIYISSSSYSCSLSRNSYPCTWVMLCAGGVLFVLYYSVDMAKHYRCIRLHYISSAFYRRLYLVYYHLYYSSMLLKLPKPVLH